MSFWPYSDEDDYKAEMDKLFSVETEQHKYQQDLGTQQRLEHEQKVRTPDGWVGHVVEMYNDGRVHVETWDNSGTYRASRLRDPMTGEPI